MATCDNVLKVTLNSVFFLAGKEWIRLPHVTPADIVAARKIKKFLSGHLDSPVWHNCILKCYLFPICSSAFLNIIAGNRYTCSNI